MKIKRTYRPELIVGKGKFRPVLNDASLQTHEGKDVLVATDGRRLVVLPVTREDGDTDGAIPPKAMQIAREAAHKKDPLSIKCNGKIEFVNEWTMPRPNHGAFPNFAQVIPAAESRTTKVSFNAKFLYDLARAIGRDTVTLNIGGPLDAILVTPAGPADGEFGVLMPVKTFDQQ